MTLKPAKISVSQEEANTVFKNSLNLNDKKEYKDLVEILEKHFPGINPNQCSGIIHRAHIKENGVLKKTNKTYSLREERENLNGLSKVKEKIKTVIDEINQIPVSEFETEEDFKDLKRIQKELSELMK